jgi:hypothetical protein
MISFSKLMMPMRTSLSFNSSLYLLQYQYLKKKKKKKKKIPKKSKGSPKSILSTEILLLVPIILLLVVSHQWATLMTFSCGLVGDSLVTTSVEKCDIGGV